MLEDIDKLAQFYACVWAKSKPVKVYWTLSGAREQKSGFYSTKFKHIKHTRIESINVTKSPDSFIVPETYSFSNGDYEFITAVTFRGIYTLDFEASLHWYGAGPLYIFTDNFAVKDGFLLKHIMYNWQLCSGGSFSCRTKGFMGKITFIYSHIRLIQADNYPIMFLSYRSVETSPRWKYLIIKDIPQGMFTTDQLDEMWSYEYPYMKRPKHISLIYLTPITHKRFKYYYKYIPELLKLNIIYIEKYNFLVYKDEVLSLRYYP